MAIILRQPSGHRGGNLLNVHRLEQQHLNNEPNLTKLHETNVKHKNPYAKKEVKEKPEEKFPSAARALRSIPQSRSHAGSPRPLACTTKPNPISPFGGSLKALTFP